MKIDGRREEKGEEEEEKRGKDKERRRELEEISLKVRLCINMCSLSFKFCFDKCEGFEYCVLSLIDEFIGRLWVDCCG